MRRRGTGKDTFSVEMNKLQYGVMKSLLPQQYSLQLQHQISLQKIKKEEGPKQPVRKNKVQKAEIFEEEDETKLSVNRVSPKTVKVVKQECKARKLKLKIKLKTQTQKRKGKTEEKNNVGKSKAKSKRKSKGKKGQQKVQKSQEQTNEFEKQEETSANKQEREFVAQIRPMLTNDVFLEQDGCTVGVSQSMAEKAQSSLRRYIKYPYPYHLKTLRRVSQKIRLLSEEQRLQIFNDICMDQCSIVDLRELPVARVLQMVDKIKKMLRQINRSFSESSDNSPESYSESSFESTS